MTKPTLQFIFDFASPNAYLTRPVLEAIARRHGITIDYKLCLLGGIFRDTGNQPPMFAYDGIKGKLAYESLETQRFITKHNVTKFKMNPHFPIMTLQLMRAATAAKKDNYLSSFIDAMLQGMWEKGLKLDDTAVLKQAFVDAGFNADKLMQQMQDPAIKQELIDNTTQAVQRGVFGIPTIFVNDEMFFGKERLTQIDEKIGQLAG